MSTSEGLRYNKGKAPFHLLPWDALTALAEHYAVGAKKYPARNWERGLIWNEGCAASLARHLAAWSSGEDVDPENGSYHDLAILWNAIALVTFRLRQIGDDDRPHYQDNQSKAQLELKQDEKAGCLKVGNYIYYPDDYVKPSEEPVPSTTSFYTFDPTSVCSTLTLKSEQ